MNRMDLPVSVDTPHFGWSATRTWITTVGFEKMSIEDVGVLTSYFVCRHATPFKCNPTLGITKNHAWQDSCICVCIFTGVNWTWVTLGQDYKEKHKTRLKTNLKLTVLNNTTLRYSWAQIVSWAPRHTRQTFIVLAPYSINSILSFSDSSYQNGTGFSKREILKIKLTSERSLKNEWDVSQTSFQSKFNILPRGSAYARVENISRHQ